MEMDWYLGQPEGLDVKWFAKRFEVNSRTIKRDLEDLQEIGQQIHDFTQTIIDKKGRERDVCLRRYSKGTYYLFAKNVRAAAESRRLREEYQKKEAARLEAEKKKWEARVQERKAREARELAAVRRMRIRRNESPYRRLRI
jgi:predicted DNA-binding transcriptional regulator YafY